MRIYCCRDSQAQFTQGADLHPKDTQDMMEHVVGCKSIHTANKQDPRVCQQSLHANLLPCLSV